jgi:hypothetical protein
LIGDLAAGRQFDTVDARLAGVLVGAGADQDSGVVLLGAEHRCGQRQALVEEDPTWCRLS